MKSIRTPAGAVLLAVFALALAACGSSSSTSSSKAGGEETVGTGGFQNPRTEPLEGGKRGGKLQVLDETDFEHIDAGIAYYSLDYEIVFATQRPLTSQKPNTAAEASPDMAESQPEISSDSKTVTVHIRHGIHFSPPVNREVTSADVAYAIERGANPNVANPYLVAGRDRADTALMETVEGLVTKGGAEGLACAALPERGLGVAVRADDGASRAAAPALIRSLALLGILTEDQLGALERFARPPVGIGYAVRRFHAERGTWRGRQRAETDEDQSAAGQLRPHRIGGDLTRAAASGDRVAHLVTAPQGDGDGGGHQVDQFQSMPATTSSVIGSYAITTTVGTLAASNYTFSFTAGTLTVTAATLTVTADAKTKTYGAANPAEFFAVATECFFEKPRQMKKKHPELYYELKDFYRQDPVTFALPPSPNRQN